VEEIWIPGGDKVFKGNWYFVTGAPLRLSMSGLGSDMPVRKRPS
jgi:hypothetical protein